MSTYLSKVSQNLKKTSLSDAISLVLDEYEDDIVSWINEQLDEGYRGNDLMPKYSPKSILLKQKKGHIFNREKRIQLYDTGAFRGSIFATNNGSSVEVSSKNYLKDELVSRYSDSIFKLNDINFDNLIS